MNTQKMKLALAVSAALIASSASGGPLAPAEPAPPAPQAKKQIKPPQVPQIETPAIPMVSDNDGSTSSAESFGAINPFAASPGGVSPNTALAPPVTITSAGAATALAISDSGTGRGLSSALTNAANANSAVYAQSGGKGPSIYGKNTGTVSSAGYFAETNKTSSQAAAFATTSGTGSAILATNTNTDNNAPVIYGSNTVTANLGVGVEGQGGEIGVYGLGYYGVSGSSDGGVGIYGSSSDGEGVSGTSGSYNGVDGSSSSGNGVYGHSDSGYGVYAQTTSGEVALYAAQASTGYGAYVYSASGVALRAISGTSYGLWGDSTGSYAVIGEDHGGGIGVFGSSVSGWAGAFDGPVTATSYSTSSDRNAKTHIAPIDSKAILELVSGLPISSWDFKSDLTRRHIGPMAQDFHAAFKLDGADDTHINLTDVAGVTLAAIQALDAEMKGKDAEIAELKAQLAAQARVMAEIKSMAEVVAARMTVLERRHGDAAPAAAVRTAARGSTGD